MTESQLKPHIADYTRTAHLSAAKLQRIAEDIGLTQSEQECELQKIAAAAEQQWVLGVASLERQRNALQQEVDDLIEECTNTQRLLGLEPTGLKLHAPSIRAALEQAQELAGTWRARKAQKQAEYEELQMANTSLRTQLGMPQPIAAKLDLTPAGFDFLHLERERLAAEQVRRLAVLNSEMARLRTVCSQVLGEDVARMAAEVHPSLRHYSFPDSSAEAPTTTDTHAASSSTATTSSQHVSSNSGVDLSTDTLEAITAKISELQGVKAEREGQLQQLEDVLLSLWQAVGVPEHAPERATFVAAMSGPTRLHMDRMEKVRAEVHRLEECRAQAMRDLTLSKARELQEVWSAAHVPVQNLKEILGDEFMSRSGPSAAKASSSSQVSSGGAAAGGGMQTPGQISDCLAKVVRMLADAKQLAERRQPVMSLINEICHTMEEIKWLRVYDADPDKYKHRDYNARLQRSQKARSTKERLPARVERLRTLLESWQLTEGEPFLYDGEDYMGHVQVMQAELQRYEQEERDKVGLRSASKKPPPGSRMGLPVTPINPRAALGSKATASVQFTTPVRRASGPGALTASYGHGAPELASLRTPGSAPRSSSGGTPGSGAAARNRSASGAAAVTPQSRQQQRAVAAAVVTTSTPTTMRTVKSRTTVDNSELMTEPSDVINEPSTPSIGLFTPQQASRIPRYLP